MGQHSPILTAARLLSAGLLAGVAAAFKLSGKKSRIVGVEPEGAPSMHLSMYVRDLHTCT